jgi:hypothetical protein
MTEPNADRVDLYARTASGEAAEFYKLADAALDLSQEIRVLRVITALLFKDPEKHNASLVRVLPALIRALDIQCKLSGGPMPWSERLGELAASVLHGLATDPDGEEREHAYREDDKEEDDVPW